jgi:hypothetical protein
LVWCAILVPGVFIGTGKGQAVDADGNTTKFLPKMVKFVERHHKNDETIF